MVLAQGLAVLTFSTTMMRPSRTDRSRYLIAFSASCGDGRAGNVRLQGVIRTERYIQSRNTSAGREHAYPRVLVVHKAKAARVSCPRIKHHPGLFDLQQHLFVLTSISTVTDK